MKYDALPNPPSTVTLVRQEKTYQNAGLTGEVNVRTPFVPNYEYFLNVEACEAAGINPIGLARQMDQVFKENTGNLWSAKIIRTKPDQPLPGQNEFSALEDSYDFSGVRAPSSEEGMSLEERTVRSELRKILRSYISNGSFAELGITTVQTAKEVKEGKLPTHKLDIETFEQMVAAAYEEGIVTIAETDDGSAIIDFSEEPEWAPEPDPVGNPVPANFSAIAERARELAKIELAKAKGVSSGPKLTLKLKG